ncbi:MAG TPA: class I SAM-dependent methyltransferase [Mycobacteriales bacterium]|nr:class I SAM-dependent methyltransferase [Mycobacteriales bacterium]
MLAAPDLLAQASARDLATAERLRRTWPVDLVAAASEQAELRERAAGKLADAATLLLTRAGLEQATSEVVARHRATRFEGLAGSVVDLCCGIGGDLRALGEVSDAVGVDRDEVHAICGRHNSGRPVVAADVANIRLGTEVAAVFIDPARREGDRRGGSRPPLAWCTSLPVERIAVKAAPGIDRSAVPAGWETEFVAHGRDLKEATLWSPAWASAGSRATVLPSGESLVRDPGTVDAPVRAPGRYLLDPSPAVTRAGAVADLAAQLDAWQIDPMIGFLSADHPLATPFGRSLTVEASLPFGVKPLAAELRRLDIGAIDIRRRGLAGDVDDLRRRLRPRGRRRATVVLTRVSEQPWAMICVDPPTDGPSVLP